MKDVNRRAVTLILLLSMCFAFALPSSGAEVKDSMAVQDSNKDSGAQITVGDNAWTLENSVLKAVVTFQDGSIDMTSFYNKAADTEYLTGSGPRTLFSYGFDNGSIAAADDGKWSLEDSNVTEIDLYDRSWGEQLEVTLTCTDPVDLQVKLVFEIYDGNAGLRYQSFIQNNTSSNLTVTKSDVLELNLKNNPHTAYYLPNMVWASTKGALSNARNCVMDYDTGDGWCMVPELNWKTNGSSDNTYPAFGGVYAWANGEQSVRFSSNPSSLQLVLFPNEEMPYLAVNLTVFQGDEMDGRASVEDHFMLRYKYWDPTTQVSINDWEWYSSGKRKDSYYRTTVVDKVLKGGIDRVNVDDDWNTDKNSTTPVSSFTSDLPSLSSYLVSKGIQIGYWFSPSGQIGSAGGPGAGGPPAGGPGAGGPPAGGGASSSDPPACATDLADWSQVETKIDQMENTLIQQYNCNWTQIDLEQLAQNKGTTSYSHASDSVYRKAVNLAKYENYFTHKYPSFAMRITNELDMGLRGDSTNGDTRNCGLIDLADNGMVSALGNYSDGDIDIATNSFGFFPMRSVFFYFGSNVWHKSTEWLYQFLASRESVLYRVPDQMDDETLALMNTFNTWRKNARIKEVLNSSYRPLESNSSNAWMFVTQDKSKAIVVATDAYKTTTSEFTTKLRWLDSDKTYFVQDITLNDNGEFTNSLVERATGAELKSKGLTVDYKTNTSNGKAYWIQEDNGSNLQVVYADSNVTSYTENMENGALTVTVTGGTANATAKIAVYDSNSKKEKVMDCTLSDDGTGTFTFQAD